MIKIFIFCYKFIFQFVVTVLIGGGIYKPKGEDKETSE